MPISGLIWIDVALRNNAKQHRQYYQSQNATGRSIAVDQYPSVSCPRERNQVSAPPIRRPRSLARHAATVDGTGEIKVENTKAEATPSKWHVPRGPAISSPLNSDFPCQSTDRPRLARGLSSSSRSIPLPDLFLPAGAPPILISCHRSAPHCANNHINQLKPTI